MAARYTTRDGDTVDLIAWRFYGATTNRETEMILGANPGLSDRGPLLDAGVTVDLPDPPARPVEPAGVRLWD